MKKQNKGAVVAIVLVCAMMLALTVYAWVEVINGVDISGIKVKPAESKGLKIKKTGDSSFSVVANASTVNAQSLSPVSTVDLVNWYVPSDVNQIGGNGSYNGDFVKINSGDASTYYYNESFSVKSSTAYIGGMRITGINVTDSSGRALSADISKAIRVGVKTNVMNESIKIFAPVSGYDASCQVVNGTNSKTEATYVEAPAKIISSAINTMDEYVIDVFVWYEGQDSNFTHGNLLNAEEIRIEIHFEGLEY